MARMTGGKEKPRRQTGMGRPLPQSNKRRREDESGKTRRSLTCPICMWKINIAQQVEPGYLVYCKGCGAVYGLSSVHPIRLRPLNFYNGFTEYLVVESEEENGFGELQVAF